MNHCGLSLFSSHDLFRTMIQPAFLGSFLPFAFKKERGKEGGTEGRMEREREEGRKEEEVIKEAQKRKENVGCLGSPFPKYFNLIIYRGLWHPTPVLLPGESHGQRSLVSCGP